MTQLQTDYMRGWTLAANMVAAGYSEAECQAFCAYVPSEIKKPGEWSGFVSAMLAGYHEEA